jgi:gluconate 2-dehydrogenase gamma chain
VGSEAWHFFTPEEGAAVEALVDRLIPPEADTPGGKDAGCAVFIDRQLAGDYGSSAALYMRPPFRDGTKNQGSQSPQTPAMRYRLGLASLDAHCRAAYLDKPFARLSGEEQDKLIHSLESGLLTLEQTSGRGFFELLVKDTQHGFLADPIYGGNRDMCAWKMIGFPGARYDYRDWIDKHNKRFPLPPVSLAGRPAWTPARG